MGKLESSLKIEMGGVFYLALDDVLCFPFSRGMFGEGTRSLKAVQTGSTLWAQELELS